MQYNIKGAYKPTESYVIKDVVPYTVNDVTKYYFCLQSNSPDNPQSPSPDGDTEYWGLVNALSNFPNSIDTFITRSPIQHSDKPHLQRFQELSLKSVLTVEEQVELDIIVKDKLIGRLIQPDDFNRLQQSITNMQMFFQTEIMVYWESVKSEIIQTKDNAIQDIENKRVSIINYLDTTEVGALKNDVGDMTLLQTDIKDNLVNAVNSLDTNHINLNDSVNEIDSIVTDVVNTLNEKANYYVPKGLISMWSGAISTIPPTWSLCDGTNGTPDLRNRFIVAAGANYTVGDIGGEGFVTLTIDQMPVHSHGTGGLTIGANGQHSHSFSGTTTNDGAHTHNVGMGYSTGGDNSRYIQAAAQSQSSGDTPNPVRTAGAHTHSFSGTTSLNGIHTHAITGDTANTGNGNSHENRPPFYALAYIMKL